MCSKVILYQPWNWYRLHFRPHCGGGGRWRPFRLQSPSWLTSFPLTVHRKLCNTHRKRKRCHPRWRGKRKGRHLPTPLQKGSKKVAHVLNDVISGAAIFDGVIQDGGAGNDVCRISRLPWRRPTDVCPTLESSRPGKGSPLSPKTSCRRLIHFLESIWWLDSPSHYQNDWGSCLLATTGKSTSLHISTLCPMGNYYTWERVSASASNYSN